MAYSNSDMENIAHDAKQDEKVRVALFISRSVDRGIEIEAAKQGIYKREAIERALRAWLGTLA